MSHRTESTLIESGVEAVKDIIKVYELNPTPAFNMWKERTTAGPAVRREVYKRVTTSNDGHYNVNHGTGTACWNVEDYF
jgi:hypothetical protein